MPPATPIAQHRFVLSLDNEFFPLQDFTGGNIEGNVVTIHSGALDPARKSISTLTYEPLVLSVGMSMGQPMIDWIKSSIQGSAERKDGSVVAVNSANKAQRYRHFSDALISEVAFPTLDGSSKEAGFFTIKFDPEEITYAKGDDAVIKPSGSIKQKKWLTSNFRLRLGDLPCNRVSKIDGFTITQQVTTPGRVDFPNLRITFSAADREAWEDWFQDFVVAGNNGQDRELSGAIELLDQTAKNVLATIELANVGIFALHEAGSEAGKDAIARYVADLYVEVMSFSINKE
jgi:phage tail-like protein